MDIQELEKYGVEPVDQTRLCGYVREALNFFHQPEICINPYLDLTLQVDITEAEQVYKEMLEPLPGSSFTAYLTRLLLISIEAFPEFSWRLVGNKWYQIRNNPLMFPVAVTGPHRIANGFIDQPTQLDWPDFFDAWRQEIRNCELAEHSNPFNRMRFIASHFIGNLPNLQFTGLTLHTPTVHGKPFFYFGKRYRSESRLYIPLAIKFHHGNTDPVLVDQLMAHFQKQLTSKGSKTSHQVVAR